MGQRLTDSVMAASDLSASQFCFVTLNSAGRVALTGAGLVADFVLLDKPNAIDHAGQVVSIGLTKCKAGAVIVAGVELTSDSTGRCVTATTNDIVNGVAREAATGAGSIILIDFNPTRAKKVS